MMYVRVVAGLPQEADAVQRQVQTVDAHEGPHQGEAVPVRGNRKRGRARTRSSDPWWRCHPLQF